MEKLEERINGIDKLLGEVLHRPERSVLTDRIVQSEAILDDITNKLTGGRARGGR